MPQSKRYTLKDVTGSAFFCASDGFAAIAQTISETSARQIPRCFIRLLYFSIVPLRVFLPFSGCVRATETDFILVSKKIRRKERGGRAQGRGPPSVEEEEACERPVADLLHETNPKT
jgi:hypothetical protein